MSTTCEKEKSEMIAAVWLFSSQVLRTSPRGHKTGAILSICRGRRANMQKYAKVFVIQNKPSFVLRERAKLLRQLFKQFIHLSFLDVLSSTSVVTAFPK